MLYLILKRIFWTSALHTALSVDRYTKYTYCRVWKLGQIEIKLEFNI